MKKFRSFLAVAALLGSAAASASPNGGISPADIAAGSALANTGSVLCTAAINTDGTIAGKNFVVSAAHLGTGQYEVIFKAPCTGITATNGWTRKVQVDTLTAGSISGNVSCTTADRSGAPDGVFVYCANGTGVTVDTSFFLLVAR